MSGVELPVHNAAGEVVDRIQLSPGVFCVPLHEAVIHQALVTQLANARQGTADTKTRAEVSGSGAKPYRQKGTGRARRGTLRAPQHKGGGVAFGPHPRSYRLEMPKKMRRLALRSALSAKVAENRLIVIDEWGLKEPKTQEMAAILGRLGVAPSALIVTPEVDRNVVRSARNLLQVKTTPASTLNLRDLLSHRTLVMSAEAVRRVEERLQAGVEG